MRERSEGADVRQSLAKLVMEILLAVEDGTVKLGQDYVPLGEGTVAVHLESVSRRLFQARRSSLSVREMRRLFRFGDLRFHDVVRGTSERMMFEREGDRRRTVVLDVVRAYEFVGSRPPLSQFAELERVS